MASPKQASNQKDQAPAPELKIEDAAKPVAPKAAEPVKTEAKEVNGIMMTFEDF